MEGVAEILRSASDKLIIPRYQSLARGDIEEKTPGEVVTIADREAEAFITEELLKRRPGARVVGEEACAHNPTLLNNLDEGTVWLVDPVDGTSNFASGRGPFASMVALLVDGNIIASWMFEPLSDRLFHAELGGGAFINGDKISTNQTSPGPSNLCGVVATRFMPTDMQIAMQRPMKNIRDLRPLMMCAGTEYPDIATGDRHFALYWRTLPWDHAPGVLFLTEAGGHAARPDGSTFKLDNRMGLLVARNRTIWQDAASILLA